MIKSIFSYSIVLLIVLAASWSLFKPGLFVVHDYVHGARIAEMARGMQDGQLPVIWSQNFGYGYGMPLFEFYAPLPYFIGALFYSFGISLVSSVKLLFWICTIFTAAGAYFLGKQLYGRAGGVITAAAITLAPYRAVNLFVRGALSEAWAIMAMVWILYCSFAVVKQKKYSWFGLVLSLVVLFLSHNLSTLLFVPFAVIATGTYAVLQSERLKGQLINWKSASKSLLKIAAGYFVAAGMAAFYLVPAFLEKSYTKIDQYILGGYFDYHLHFVYLRQFLTPFWGYGGSQWGPDDGISFFLGIGQLLGLLAFGMYVVGFLVSWSQKKRQRVSVQKLIFLLVVSALFATSLLLATQKALPIWENLELLTYVQFPWRTLSVALILIGMLVPAFLLGIKVFVPRWGWAWALLLVLLFNAWMFRPESWLENSQSLYYGDELRIRMEMSGILPDYIPADLSDQLQPAQQLVVCSDCSPEVLVNRSQEKLVAVNPKEPSLVTFNVANYPGWKAELNGVSVPVEETEEGLIAVSVPQGSSKVGILLGATETRKNANIISVIATAVFVLLFFLLNYKGKTQRSQNMKKEVTAEDLPDTTLEISTIKRRSIMGAFSYFSRTLLLQGIGLAASLVLSALLSPEDYGLYGAVMAIIGILVFFSDIGLAAALVQKKQEITEDEYTTAFTIQQGLAWVIFLVTVIIAWSGVLTDKWGPASNWIMLSLGLSFPLASLKTIPSIILERKLDFSKLVIPQIVEQLLFNGTLIVAVVMGLGVLSYIPAVLLRSLAGVVTMFILQPWKLKFGFSKKAFQSLIGFGVKFQLNDFLARIKDQLFYLTLAFFLPANQFGYINWAKNWSMYPYNLTVQNVMAITFPAFSRLQHDKKYLQRAIEKSLFFISLVIFPILAGMAIFIHPVLKVFPVYAHWQPAAFSLIFFTLSIAGGAISTPLTNTLNALGHISTTLKLMIIWTVLTWVLTPLAIYFMGYNGVAFAALIISLTSFMPVIFVRKIVQLNVGDQLWRQVVATVVMAIVGYYGLNFWSQSLEQLLLGVGICGVVYLGTLFAVGHKKVLAELHSLRT